MIIRNINENDIFECSKLYIKVFAEKPWNEVWEINRVECRLSHFFNSQGFAGFLAESDKEIVGFIVGNSEPFRLYDIFYLREMCIKTELQRNGIGRKLFSELENKLIEKDIKSIYLTTQHNIPASQFYQKVGFKISEEMRFFSKRINNN
jgi:ribosomal protein S18 acetylase RimI-like enzyme